MVKAFSGNRASFEISSVYRRLVSCTALGRVPRIANKSPKAPYAAAVTSGELDLVA